MELAEPVGKLLDLMDSRARDRGVCIDVELEDDLKAWADPGGLEHALVNLVENAIKYTPKGGMVGVHGRLDGDRVRIEVWDTGPGIASEHRARLFERFYRVDPGRSREQGGTGLGLSIVKHLVNAMDGDVGMEPRSEGGSIFYIELGLREEALGGA